MRSLHVCAIAVAAALVGSLATLGAQKQLQRSTVFEWASLEAKTTQTGARRDVMRAPTPTLDELEIHITTLNPGQVSHPPHQHPEEEFMLVTEGAGEIMCDGKISQVRPGSMMYCAGGKYHAIENTGDTPMLFYYYKWLP